MSDPDAEQAAQPAVNGNAAPVSGTERISSLDVLRGVAILGILVINIYGFAMPYPAYSNPLLMGGTDPLNMGTWFFTHIFVEQKFLSIFSMLFGSGIILMTGRAEQRGAKYGRIFYRRQFWLLILGALHAYFIWLHDILFLYAAIGMLAYLFRNRTPRTLIISASGLLLVTLLMNFGIGGQTQVMQSKVEEITVRMDAGEELTEEEEGKLAAWREQRAFFAPNAEDLQEDVALHQGAYAEITAYRLPLALQLQSYGVVLLGWHVLALMLIGMALMKTGVLAAERSASFYRNMMLIAYGIGLPLMVYSAVGRNAHDFDSIYVFGMGGLPNFFGSIIVGLGHIGLVMMWIKGGFMQKLLQRFAAVGRMALSNYLLHSIILTTVFYGYGLGLYGSIPRFGQMGFVVAVIALQLLLSPWWLARYRFGPFEWLWRSLTYWQRQPMLR